MKKILLLLALAFTITATAQADKTVTLTLSGQGKTQDEAKQVALRSAIEQACEKAKKKHTVFEPFNLRIYFENFT